jgi:hypothetical protein
MDEITTNACIRRQRALQRLGSNTPQCCCCREHDPRCLEAHHIAGQRHHGDTVTVCRNCHRKLSDLQLDHPPAPGSPSDRPAIIGHYLLGLADLFRLISERLVEFGHALVSEGNSRAR